MRDRKSGDPSESFEVADGIGRDEADAVPQRVALHARHGDRALRYCEATSNLDAEPINSGFDADREVTGRFVIVVQRCPAHATY